MYHFVYCFFSLHLNQNIWYKADDFLVSMKWCLFNLISRNYHSLRRKATYKICRNNRGEKIEYQNISFSPIFIYQEPILPYYFVLCSAQCEMCDTIGNVFQNEIVLLNMSVLKIYCAVNEIFHNLKYTVEVHVYSVHCQFRTQADSFKKLFIILLKL